MKRVAVIVTLAFACVMQNVNSGVAALAQGNPGTIRVGLLRNGSYEITTLPLETYVARVVAGEAAMGSAPAALEVMAITVRTYALANRNRHRADGFDLCDQTHCQVVRAATPATDRAAAATAGQVLLRDGQPASVYYSASCGGRTERPSAVWPGADDPDYLPSRVDDACGGTPAWSAVLAGAELQRSLNAAGFRGTLRAMSIRSRSESGRVAQLAVDGLTPGAISGQDLRVAVGRTLGWQHIKSTVFDLNRTGGSYRFEGHGSGHGVGLCVIGATRLAASGQSAPTILSRYFPGLEIGSSVPRLTAAPAAAPKIGPARARGNAVPSPAAGAGAVATAAAGSAASAAPSAAAASVSPRASSPPATVPSDILLTLPDEDEGERAAVGSLADRARRDLAKALSISRLPALTLRFHATTDEYERVTGQPWFTSGTIRNNQAHFVPLASLRDRGVLERTLRRELAHVIVDPELASRPAWVREGAALFYADALAPEGAGLIENRSPGPKVSCPQDSELLGPVSAGSLADAYARARACFARQIASGRSWREVR